MKCENTSRFLHRLSWRSSFAIAAAIWLCAPFAAKADSVSISISPSQATIQNAFVRLTYDLRKGTYDIDDLIHHARAIVGAFEQIGKLNANDAGFIASASQRDARDNFNGGKILRIQSDRAGSPSLLLDITVYPNQTFVSLASGIENKTASPMRIHEYHPLTGGILFPDQPWSDAQTLDGMSATHQTRVINGPMLSSANDMLLTFEQADLRRSVVLGALTTSDFTKWVYTKSTDGSGDVASSLSNAIPRARLVSFLDCGRVDASSSNGPTLRTTAGETYSFPAASTYAPFGDALYEAKEARIHASGLDPHKRYALGWIWWDYDGNGRTESVDLSGSGIDRVLVNAHPLPQFLTLHQPPGEMARIIPPSCYQNGQLDIAFKNDSSAPNAVVNSAWLWELSDTADIPADWLQGRPIARSMGVSPMSSSGHGQDAHATSIAADLQAFDPVGRLIKPGETYLPADSFYVDVTTSNPFEALEKYGHALATATHAQPHLYDFPTVCAWYAGVWHTPGAQDHPEKSTYQINTTSGLVEEMRHARERGFLNYSRIAMRLVPDTYQVNNPQGWWDNSHWHHFGYYTLPYNTSQKFGHAIQELGGLAFTYFQPECIWLSLKFGTNAAALSQDFRDTHADLLIGDDRNHSLDYTKPATQEYMRQIFASMRGAISGIMFDYCDDFWMADASRGGFADPHATATSYYRKLFQLAKQGLGENSWIHERNLGRPNNDLTLGYVDLQRTSTDTDKITPDMVSRSGLRWYKNRVVINYDMDSKDIHGSWKVPGFTGSDTDGRRMMLTMEYVAGSRLLLANSIRDLSTDELYDLERVMPFPTWRQSARPIDAFTNSGWPRVYDFAINPQWHQLTLYNNALPTTEQTIRVPLLEDNMHGGLALDPSKQYYFYDFWNDRFAGRRRGNDVLSQTLRPGEARMLSVHEVESHPQFLSTNRHLMQGYYDLAALPDWSDKNKTLSAKSRVVAHEPYQITIAANGYTPSTASADNAKAAIQLTDGPNQLIKLTISSEVNEVVSWQVQFK